MNNLLNKVEEILLMGPGPSCVPDSVYDALAKKTIGHLDPHFLCIMGSGSAGMEASFVNLVEAGDQVLVLINGVFGMRMQDVATRLGAEVDTLEYEWGTPVNVDEAKNKIAEKNYKIIAVVHAETSTGVRNPVAEIGEFLKRSNAIYIVDAVTSLGGMNVSMDECGIDVLYSGTQKCLSCPPGLAPISFSDKAVKTLISRKTKVPNWYLDLNMIINYWEGKTRVYHHTAPINMLYALYQALFLILEEGLENVYRRHLENHQVLVTGLEEMGIKMLVEPAYRLPMLNSIYVPKGIDEAAVRKELLFEHKIEIGSGLGPLAGKIWRIGLMGHTARPENVSRLLNALKIVLKKY